MGFHTRLTPGNRRHVDVHADTAARCGLAGGARETGTTQVLDADNQALVQQLEACLDQALLLERIANLNARPLVAVVCLGEAGRGQHAHTSDAVTTGAGAQQDGQVPDS